MLLRRQRIDQPQEAFDLAVELREYATSYLVGGANGFTGDGRPVTFGGGLVVNETWQGKAYRGDTADNIAYATPSRNFVFGTDKDFTFVIVARKRFSGIDTGHIAGFGATGGSSGNTLFRLVGGVSSANAVRLQGWDSAGATFLNTDSSDFGWDDLNYHGIVIKGRVAHSGTDNGGCAYFADGKTAGAPGGSSATNPSATTFNVVSACGARRGGTSLGFGPYDVALFVPLIGIQMPDEWCLRASSLDAVWQTCFEPRRIWVPVSAAAGAYTLTAETGAFTLTGNAAGLAASRQLAAATGAFTLAGQAAGLAYGRALTAEAGAFSLTGQGAAITAARQLAAGVGTFTLTGIDVGLIYTPASGAYTLTADTGAFTLTGNPAGLTVARSLAAAAGSFSLTGLDATLERSGYRLPAETGAFALAGQDATFSTTAAATTLRGRVRRRTRTPLPPEDTLPPAPPEPAPAIRTLVQGANELIVTKGREVITLQRVAEAKRRALARKAEEEAIERALMEWF